MYSLKNGDKDTTNICKKIASACSSALTTDVLVPRPGLSSIKQPRTDLDPLSILYTSPIGYEVCLCSCIDPDNWVKCWFNGVKEMSRLWGNTGLGSLFLLSLHSASTILALSKGLNSIENVMGFSQELIEISGVEGAVLFYKALSMLNPSYLYKISWSGLPDASNTSSWFEVYEKSITLRELLDLASIYDPVSRDAIRQFSISLGIAYPLIVEKYPCIESGVKNATHTTLLLEGDLLLRRKTQYKYYLVKKYNEDSRTYSTLSKLEAGPGSIADIVINALFRVLFERVFSTKTSSYNPPKLC